jgi:hypothetical protein
MSGTQPKFLCDAVAVAESNRKLFITVFQVGDGIEFSSGRGETKHGSPRHSWTNDNIKREIAIAFGAKTVELNYPAPETGKRGSR